MELIETVIVLSVGLWVIVLLKPDSKKRRKRAGNGLAFATRQEALWTTARTWLRALLRLESGQAMAEIANPVPRDRP